MHLLYLHGFASSPASGKAAFFRDRLALLGMPLHAPDLNRPDFSTLTVSRMIDQVREAAAVLAPGPVALVGSSLGGFVALHMAARRASDALHPVTRLVLLAPAVDFASGRDGWLSAEEIETWRRTDSREVFHHADGCHYPVRFALYEDGHRYDAFDVDLSVPTLVFQGRRDTIVDPSRVAAWAARRANVTLRMLDDDHQLLGHLDPIWDESAAFLGVTKLAI
jgi:uncharacterized protein